MMAIVAASRFAFKIGCGHSLVAGDAAVFLVAGCPVFSLDCFF
jgi:hypothetical protein